jgi:CheY-like chemotaxis protein
MMPAAVMWNRDPWSVSRLCFSSPAETWNPDGSRSRAGEIATKSRLAKAARFSTIPCNLPLLSPMADRGTKALAKILVVDDDPAVQMTIRLLLERAGHRVTVAGDGQKGLSAFESEDFDLLFLDIFMPGMDGIETMRHIHRHRPTVPIIVISGRPLVPEASREPDFLAMAIKLGAVSSLPKPFKPAVLLATVEGCLNARKRNAASGP